MAVYSMRCPHCNTDKVLFTSVADSVIQQFDFYKNFDGSIASSTYNLFIHCNNCLGGCVLLVKMKKQCPSSPHNIPNGTEFEKYYEVYACYPKCHVNEPPDHVSNNISRIYMQAVDSFQRSNFDASGAMFRKTLDIATKELGSTSGKLHARINELAEKHEITPAMKEWAHAIRLDGNDATHEEDAFDKVTCEALKSFTELFLLYAFTLPGLLAERRAKKSS
ncbi:MAG: hypothetical protein CVU73_12845 [Deltaproteobacteria bacterium HGW-Deltaproteobacteria-8]|jgi:rubredoxin|nr:MAG: hypothetical protein CVU73_12845 [Deltaproteobacteria bacterium HGW-Deltaproteobacteria-8]